MYGPQDPTYIHCKELISRCQYWIFFLYATNYNITITLYYIAIICVSLQTTCEITEVGYYRESFNPNDVFIVDTGSVAYQVK